MSLNHSKLPSINICCLFTNPLKMGSHVMTPDSTSIVPDFCSTCVGISIRLASTSFATRSAWEKMDRGFEKTLGTWTWRNRNFHMGVSKNRGTPKSSMLIGFSIINHPFWGTTIFGNTHILLCNPPGNYFTHPTFGKRKLIFTSALAYVRSAAGIHWWCLLISDFQWTWWFRFIWFWIKKWSMGCSGIFI